MDLDRRVETIIRDLNQVNICEDVFELDLLGSSETDQQLLRGQVRPDPDLSVGFVILDVTNLMKISTHTR